MMTEPNIDPEKEAEKQDAYRLQRLERGYAIELQNGVALKPEKPGRIQQARTVLMSFVAKGK